ncbi:cytochrome c oxidase assembly protein [uncultured Amnibacterium sp.]|uniref:cytochrome c oxidase assembly protein n=1 Tax=uncultured Amnibacterium sp. TaxID=1631851 RepID=UPI0035CB0B89
MHRAARVAWPALTFLVAIVSALVVTTALAGGADGLLVARVAALIVLDLATGAVLGILAAVLLVLPLDDARRERLLDVAAGAAAIWTAAAATTMFLLYLGAAPAVSDPAFGSGIVTFVADVAIGRTWLLSAVGAAVLTAALLAVRSPAGIAVLAAAAVLAVIPEALQGPSTGDPLATARSIAGADLVQLTGTGAWIGLTVLAVALDAPPAVRRRVCALSVVIGIAVVGATVLRAPLESGDGVPTAALLLPVIALVCALGVAVAGSRTPSRGLLRVALLLLAGVSGFTSGTAVGRRAPLQPAARSTPAEILTGSALPAPMSPGRLALDLRPDAVWLVVGAALLGAYVAGVVVLRRRGGTWPTGRVASWIVGLVLLGWLTSGGIAVYQEVLLSTRLVQHAALLLPVPLLLAGGAPLQLLRRVGPGSDGVGSIRAGLLAVARAPLVAVVTRPVPAAVIAVVVVGAVDGTGLLRWSLTDPVGAEAVVALCLVAGALVVASCVSGDASRRVAVTVAVVLLVVEAAGAAVLALGSGLLLASWYGAMGWGTDALADQRAGASAAGVILLVSTGVLLLAAARKAPRGAARPRPVAPIQEEVPA